MKKLILSAAMLLLAVVGNAQETPNTQQNEWLPTFTAVVVNAPLDITFVRVADTEAPKIVYDTKGSYTTKFKAEVKERTLRITERTDARRPERTSVTVYYNDLQSIDVSNATATFDGTIKTAMLDMTVGGDGRVTASLEVEDLAIDVSGRSVATLTGKSRYLTLTLSTGEAAFSQLETMSAQVNATSGGTAALWVSERLEAKTSTKGKITYKGTPRIVRSGVGFMGGEIKRAE